MPTRLPDIDALLLPQLLCCCMLLLFQPPGAAAQPVPFDAPLEEVAITFLKETASPVDTIPRYAFRERLGGELRRTDPDIFKGMLPRFVDLDLDSIIRLPSRGDGLERGAVFVSVHSSVESFDQYIYGFCDSIWRISALRRFPTILQQSQLKESLTELDTTLPAGRILYHDLRRVLESDEALCRHLRENLTDATRVAVPLWLGNRWQTFPLREYDFTDVGEYRELDDDIDRDELLFYKLDRRAMERIKWSLRIQKIERDPRYPGVVFLKSTSIGPDTFGYIYARDPEALPPISSDEFILLKPAAENWWLYKRVNP